MIVQTLRGPVTLDIVVNNTALVEYDDPQANHDDSERIGTKYIETIADAEFEFHMQFGPGFEHCTHAAAVEFFLDGQCVERRGLNIEQYTWRKLIVEGVSYQVSHSDNRATQRFAFSQLRIGDDTADTSAAEGLRDLGLIEVKLSAADFIGHEQRSRERDLRLVAEEIISEKALKGRAISHGISLGRLNDDPATRVQRYIYNASLRRKAREPFATFRFKYRSHSDLKTDWIIPRSPTPDLPSSSPTPSRECTPLVERDEEDLNVDELREAVRRLREMKGVSVKREAPTERRIKREASGERRINSLSPCVPEDSSQQDEGRIAKEARAGKRRRIEGDPRIEVITIDD